MVSAKIKKNTQRPTFILENVTLKLGSNIRNREPLISVSSGYANIQGKWIVKIFYLKIFHKLYFDNILSPLVTPPRSFLPFYPPKFMFSLCLSLKKQNHKTHKPNQNKKKLIKQKKNQEKKEIRSLQTTQTNHRMQFACLTSPGHRVSPAYKSLSEKTFQVGVNCKQLLWLWNFVSASPLEVTML